MVLTLNRPSTNALNFEVIAALQTALRKATRDPSIRCVLLSGSGDVFSAGQDLSEPGQIEHFSFRPHVQRAYNPLVLQIVADRLAQPEGGWRPFAPSGVLGMVHRALTHEAVPI